MSDTISFDSSLSVRQIENRLASFLSNLANIDPVSAEDLGLESLGQDSVAYRLTGKGSLSLLSLSMARWDMVMVIDDLGTSRHVTFGVGGWSGASGAVVRLLDSSEASYSMGVKVANQIAAHLQR